MTHQKLTFADHKSLNFKHPISLLADNITLKENVGSLFRLCDALGVEHLYLSKTDDLSNNKLSKVARNTEKNVPHSITQSPLETIAQLKQDGYTIISLEITSQSINIRDFDFGVTDKICLILGNEARGVDDALLATSDHCVYIPTQSVGTSKGKLRNINTESIKAV